MPLLSHEKQDETGNLLLSSTVHVVHIDFSGNLSIVLFAGVVPSLVQQYLYMQQQLL